MARVRRLFRKGELLEVEITDMAFGGKGIGKITTDDGEFTLFVLNSLPGQLVQARITKCKNRYAEAKLELVLRPAKDQVELQYQEIPGAPYASLPIELQHQFKERTTLELYKRIGKLEHIEEVYKGLIPSPTTWHYRNKMEYSFAAIVHRLDTNEKSDEFGFGFKHRGTWWAVENLDRDSGLFDKLVEDHLITIRNWCEESGLPAWHPPRREGFYRFMVARKSYATGKLLFNFVTSSAGLEKFDQQAFIALMKSCFGDRLHGILHTVNDDTGDRVEARDGESTLIYGEEKLIENIGGLDFEMSMYSFFQTNPQSAERLYAAALEAIGDSVGPEDVVLDLFCGTGTISQLVARNYDCKVVGVDLIASAIEDAKANALRNNIKGIKFYAEDAGKFLFNHPEYTGKLKTIVLDPPRAGISPKTLRKVIRLGAKRLVYISCNPATQARDAALLRESGYELEQLQLCDQFPHTSHVEAIAVFELRHYGKGLLEE